MISEDATHGVLHRFVFNKSSAKNFSVVSDVDGVPVEPKYRICAQNSEASSGWADIVHEDGSAVFSVRKNNDNAPVAPKQSMPLRSIVAYSPWLYTKRTPKFIEQVQDGWVMSIQVDDPDPGRLRGCH